MPTDVERRLSKVEATARQRHPLNRDAAALLADGSLSAEWWDRAERLVASATGASRAVVHEDVARGSRETNEDRTIRRLHLSTPPDAMRAALTDPITWGEADDHTRHQMVADEIARRVVRELMKVFESTRNVPSGTDFTAVDLGSNWGGGYVERLLAGIARTGAITPTGEKRDSWTLYRANSTFDPKAFIAANKDLEELTDDQDH